MSELSDYTQKGDTFWMIEKECPECGGALSSNGTVYTCITTDDCGWWALIEEYSSSTGTDT